MPRREQVDLEKRKTVKGLAALGALAAAGCVPPPDQWFNEEKRQAFKDQQQSAKEDRQRRREDKKVLEEREEKVSRDWEDNSRIEVQPFLEEEVRSWDEAVEAQKYYRKMERRFAFYGSYGGYKSFEDFIREHPQLKKNSEIFKKTLESGETEKDFISGMQAPADLKGFIEKHGGNNEQFITAIGAVESRFNNEAAGAAGEVGLMQIKPGTAAGYGAFDLTDPEQNIKAGSKHYGEMFKHTQDQWLAMAAYNAGLSRIQESLLPALPRGAKPIEILRRMKTIKSFPNTTRDYLIKAALALDYIDEEEAQKYASDVGVVGTGVALRDKYNK